MKNSYAYFALLLLVLSQMSCQDKKKSFETTSSVAGDSTLKVPTLENYSNAFKAILKTDAGMVRGLSIGDEMDSIVESAPFSETQPNNGKSYTEYFDDTDLNFADVLYVKDVKNKIGAISVDIFIEKQVAVDSLMNEFKGYFNKKYGQGKGISKMMVWKLTGTSNELLLQNVSTAKDPGLKIIFAKNGNKFLQ
ncbi:MAG: hypothetical protein H7339_18425 [Arcicella sp.]|nr:hypothetical protein [Arcicella sp.]